MARSEKHDPGREFDKLLDDLTYSHNKFEVWEDFVIMTACALSNGVSKNEYDKREKLYLRTVSKYKKAEAEKFPLLLAETVLALEENPEQDFLGRRYMLAGLSANSGQVFTPYNICDMMAEIILGNLSSEIKEKGFITVSDPTCGAGALLIAAANVARRKLEKEKQNFQNHILLYAQDIDMTVALMCYIQLSLLGVAGVVKIGNSLTEPITDGDNLKNYWFTPMYCSGVWAARRMINKIKHL